MNQIRDEYKVNHEWFGLYRIVPERNIEINESFKIGSVEFIPRDRAKELRELRQVWRLILRIENKGLNMLGNASILALVSGIFSDDSNEVREGLELSLHNALDALSFLEAPIFRQEGKDAIIIWQFGSNFNLKKILFFLSSSKELGIHKFKPLHYEEKVHIDWTCSSRGKPGTTIIPTGEDPVGLCSHCLPELENRLSGINFLFDRNRHGESNIKAIFKALKWYYESKVTCNDTLAFLFLWLAIEVLIRRHESEYIRSYDKVKERIKLAVNLTQGEERILGEACDLRHKIVHTAHHQHSLPEEYIELALYILDNLLMTFIELSRHCKSSHQIWNEIKNNNFQYSKKRTDVSIDKFYERKRQTEKLERLKHNRVLKKCLNKAPRR